MFHVLGLLAVALIAALVAAGPAGAQDTPALDPARLTAAKDLLDATGATKQMDGMFDAMAQGLRKGLEQDPSRASEAERSFKEFVGRFAVHRQAMLDEIAALYASRFTASELSEIADFYKSGPGAKFVAAMPELMQEGAQIGIKYSQKAVQEAEEAKQRK